MRFCGWSPILYALHQVADVAHPCKPWEVHHKWSELVTEEFFKQVCSTLGYWQCSIPQVSCSEDKKKAGLVHRRARICGVQKVEGTELDRIMKYMFCAISCLLISSAG